MRPLLLVIAVLLASCSKQQRHSNPPPVRAPRDTTRVRAPAPVRDTALEQRAARLELRVLEQEAQVSDLQTRLDEARREVVRGMAKLQSLATRAEAASGMAEAEIALQALRAANGNNSSAPPEWFSITLRRASQFGDRRRHTRGAEFFTSATQPALRL